MRELPTTCTLSPLSPRWLEPRTHAHCLVYVSGRARPEPAAALRCAAAARVPSSSTVLPIGQPPTRLPPPQAYADYTDMMELTEELVRACANAVCGTPQVMVVAGGWGWWRQLLVSFVFPGDWNASCAWAAGGGVVGRPQRAACAPRDPCWAGAAVAAGSSSSSSSTVPFKTCSAHLNCCSHMPGPLLHDHAHTSPHGWMLDAWQCLLFLQPPPRPHALLLLLLRSFAHLHTHQAEP